MTLRSLARVTALGSALLLGTIGSAPAQEQGKAEAHGGDTSAHTTGQEHEGGEGHHENALGLVLGGTYESEEEQIYFTWGVEYERLFTPRFAVLVGLENITDIDAWVLAAPLVYRHPSGWRLMAGPGVELKPRRPGLERPEHGRPEEQAIAAGVDSIKHRINDGKDQLFLMRFGTGWTLEAGERFEVAPMVFGDAVREEGEWVWAVVFTVSIGFAF